MDREIIARQVDTLARDLAAVTDAMAKELAQEAEIRKKAERAHKENLKRAEGEAPSVPHAATTGYSPVNHYRSRLDFVKTRLDGVIDYMKQRQVW